VAPRFAGLRMRRFGIIDTYVNHDNHFEFQTLSTARNKLKSAQKRPSIIAACWAQATLW
jgi:hypothetical protein